MTKKVIERAPENFMAWAINSFSHLHESSIGYRDATTKDLAVAEEAARRAVHLNGQSDFAHAMLAIVSLNGGNLANARREVDRSLELNVHSPMAGLFLAQTMIYGGEPEEGIAKAMQAAEIFKRMPVYYAALYCVALGHFVCRRYKEAIDWAARAQLQAPNQPRSLIVQIAASAHCGDIETAKSHAGHLLAAYPEFSLATLRRLPFSDPEPWDRLLDGLRRAALPEQ